MRKLGETERRTSNAGHRTSNYLASCRICLCSLRYLLLTLCFSVTAISAQQTWKSALQVAVNSLGRECWKADRDIFSAFGAGCAIAHPFIFFHHQCLAFNYPMRSFSRLCLQFAAQNDREFVEFWSLPRFAPT